LPKHELLLARDDAAIPAEIALLGVVQVGHRPHRPLQPLIPQIALLHGRLGACVN
jgi:hypothetical protein